MLSAAPGHALSPIDPSIDSRIQVARTELLSSPPEAQRHAEAIRKDVMAQLRGRQRALGLAAADWINGAALIAENKPKQAAAVAQRALQAITPIARDSGLRGELLLVRPGIGQRRQQQRANHD